MIRRLFDVALVMGILSLVSCEKELDFRYRDMQPFPVIEGVLTDAGCNVSVTLATPMGEPMDGTHVTDAVVKLENLSSGDEMILSPDDSGYFVGHEGGVVGQTYRLTVEYGGDVYESDAEMLAPVEITGMEFEWVKMPYDYVALLQVSFVDDPAISDERYWLRVYRNGEPYKWITVSDAGSSEGVLDVAMLTSRKDLSEEDDDDALHEGDIVSASVSAISAEMCAYLDALMAGGSSGAQLFSGPLCRGYFMAATPGESSLVFHAD